MRLVPAQTRALVEACGFVPSTTDATNVGDTIRNGSCGVPHRLEIRIEPMRPAIRVSLDAASIDVPPGDGLWECDARTLLVRAGLAAALPSAAALVAAFDAFCKHELLLLDVDLSTADSRLAFSAADALCDDGAAF